MLYNFMYTSSCTFSQCQVFSQPSISQPSIYIDGWLYAMSMTSVTSRCCLKTIPHIIILSSRHESDIPSLPGRQVSSSQSGGITPVAPDRICLPAELLQLLYKLQQDEDEVAKLIRSIPAKSSPLDFVPTSLLKACRYTFANVITRLANLSVEHATFPAKFKTASVTPLLKKHGMDTTDPASYRQYQT